MASKTIKDTSKSLYSWISQASKNFV